MGGLLTCICCYCCLMSLKPRCIEIIALICNLIEIVMLIWGIADIPWDDVKKGGKITFFIGCTFVAFTLLFLLALMCLRCGNKVNTTKNGSGKCLCMTIIILDILTEIFIIIGETIIIYNMKDEDDKYYDNNYDFRRKKVSKYSDREWAAAAIATTIAEFSLAIHCYCASFLIKLISYRTNLSYVEYHENKQKNDVSRTIGIFNSPQNGPPNNQLTFIGYDKYGNPIYSGNAQYFSPQPNITNNTLNNTSDTLNQGESNTNVNQQTK